MVLSQKVGNIPLQSPKSLSVSLPYQHPPTHPHNTSYALASTSCYKSFIIGLCAEPPADSRVNKCLYLVRWFREAAQRRFWFWLRAAKLFLPALLEPKHWWMSRPFLMRPSFHCQTCTPSEWTLTRHFCTASFIGLWNQITLMAMSMTAVCPSWSNQRQASDFADWDPASSQGSLATHRNGSGNGNLGFAIQLGRGDKCFVLFLIFYHYLLNLFAVFAPCNVEYKYKRHNRAIC